MPESLSVLRVHEGRVRDAVAAVRAAAYDAVVIDLRLADADPIDAVAELHAAVPDVPIVVTGPAHSGRLARQALSEGAVDFLSEDEDSDAVLAHVVRSAGFNGHHERIALARHDPVTGAVSGPLFRDRLACAMARAARHQQPVALFAADVDGLARVNEELGHEQGDELLRVVAQRLEGSVRSVDTVARYGGDEFLVLLEEVGTRADALTVARRLAASVANPVHLAGQRVEPTVCIGLAMWPDHATTGERLRHTAQAALFSAQSEGAGSVHVAEPLPRSQRNSHRVAPRS